MLISLSPAHSMGWYKLLVLAMLVLPCSVLLFYRIEENDPARVGPALNREHVGHTEESCHGIV